MAEIPIVLCFDDRILLGAGVTIKSMINAAKPSTQYEINILHPGFSDAIKSELRILIEGTQHRMRFFEIQPERFDDAPSGRGSWTEIVYYRLLTCEILSDRDKAIYSDVDVFFKKDMSEVFETDLAGIEWAGVAAETNTPEKTMHYYFPENTKEKIIFSGFMLMNLDLMRRNDVVTRYFDTIKRVGNRLRFFDLDLLNIATPKIAELPFAYVTLEDVYESDDVTAAADYFYLKSVYSVADLEAARDDPAIIHYAGRRGKPWQRQHTPAYYLEVENSLPKGLRAFNFRSFRKKWLSRKGRRRYPTRSAR